MDDVTLRMLWDMMDETMMQQIWKMLSDEQLLELRDRGIMDQRTMESFETELFLRCLIDLDELPFC